MPGPEALRTTSDAGRRNKDSALDAALDRLAPAASIRPRRPHLTPAPILNPLPESRPCNPQFCNPAMSPTSSPDLHVTAVRRLEAAAAEYAPFPGAVDARLRAALATRGIEQLYTHQAEAVDHALAGRHVVVVTPTASGKTLCYNVPILNAILQDPSSRALYLFPTKALAQDQLAELQGLVRDDRRTQTGEQIGVFTYDGDTPPDARRTIRARAHLVLSNPDMLHAGILPHHPRWAKLFENLRYVVIDELHAYRGVFGSHLAQRAAAPAARLPALRVGPGLPLLVGDDRQPAGAGRDARRSGRSSSSTRAARRAARSSSSSSTRRSSTTSWASAARI